MLECFLAGIVFTGVRRLCGEEHGKAVDKDNVIAKKVFIFK